MKKFDLLDYDENKLPDVTLTKEQRDRIKSLNTTLRFYLDINPRYDIDISYENIKSIEEKLGDKKDKRYHLIKHAMILKELVLQCVEKKLPFKDEDIIYSKFFLAGQISEYNQVAPVWNGITFYQQVYLTKNRMLIYCFDECFRVTRELNIELKYIKKVGVITKAQINELKRVGLIDAKELDFGHSRMIMTLKNIIPDQKGSVPAYMIFCDENYHEAKDIIELADILQKLNVSPYDVKKMILRRRIFKWAFYIPAAILLLRGLLMVWF